MNKFLTLIVFTMGLGLISFSVKADGLQLDKREEGVCYYENFDTSTCYMVCKKSWNESCQDYACSASVEVSPELCRAPIGWKTYCDGLICYDLKKLPVKFSSFSCLGGACA